MDSTTENSLLISVVILFSLAFLLHYYEGSENTTPEFEATPIVLPECFDALSESCLKGSCSGIRECINGSWSPCNLDVICEPGKLYGCSFYGCSSGYRACDACGTGFGPCVGPGTDNLNRSG